MSHLATDPDRAAVSNHRAHVLAEAVVSAYIDEIARSARPRRTHDDGTHARRRPQPGADEARSSARGRPRSLTAATNLVRHDAARRGKLGSTPQSRVHLG
jgi:hypothetical protein